MSIISNYSITADELKWAFKEFNRLDLRHLVNFSNDARILEVMGRYTRENSMISAGCETGIKLGLLIADKRSKA